MMEACRHCGKERPVFFAGACRAGSHCPMHTEGMFCLNLCVDCLKEDQEMQKAIEELKLECPRPD